MNHSEVRAAIAAGPSAAVATKPLISLGNPMASGLTHTSAHTSGRRLGPVSPVEAGQAAQLGYAAIGCIDLAYLNP